MLRNMITKSFTKTMLGRWERSCEATTKIKVDWANVDHCGTCSKEDLKSIYFEIKPSSVFNNFEDVVYCVDAYHDLESSKKLE